MVPNGGDFALFRPRLVLRMRSVILFILLLKFSFTLRPRR